MFFSRPICLSRGVGQSLACTGEERNGTSRVTMLLSSQFCEEVSSSPHCISRAKILDLQMDLDSTAAVACHAENNTTQVEPLHHLDSESHAGVLQVRLSHNSPEFSCLLLICQSFFRVVTLLALLA